MKSKIKIIILILAAAVIGGWRGSGAMASATDGTIDPSLRYAWTENAGWLDFGTSQGNVHVTDSALTGYAWGEDIGWVSLNCSNDNSCATSNYKVVNDGSGNLSGYAWTENAGWIQFNPAGGGVVIDSSGKFSGYAWGEDIGWVVFNCSTTNSCAAVDYKVATDWRPAGAQTSESSALPASIPPISHAPGQASPSQSRISLPAGPASGVATINQMTRAQILAAIANIQTAIAGLQQQLAALGGGTTTYSCASITKNLFYGMASDPQVRCLQEFLTAQKYFTVPATGNYFAVTQVAVSRFQEKYAGEILTPFGLKTGTGIVGLKTRQVINRLLGAPSN